MKKREEDERERKKKEDEDEEERNGASDRIAGGRAPREYKRILVSALAHTHTQTHTTPKGISL